MEKEQIDLSIIITAHKEGILAHKTVLGILRCADELEKQKITYEIIVSLDNPDEITEKYYSRWRNNDKFSIINVSFGNPADNRNNAISKARGKYVSVIDGDDIPSRNWLVDSYNILKQKKGLTIVRPNFNLQFSFDNDEKVLWVMESSFSKEEDAIIMSYWNRWSMTATAPAEVFKKFKYKPALNGFGYEDYLWNCETRAADIPCVVAPGTVIFYRRRQNSVTASHFGTILDYSNLFDYDFINSINLPQDDNKKTNKLATVNNVSRKLYNFTRYQASRLAVSNRFLSSTVLSFSYKVAKTKIPQTVIDAWRDVNSIENQLYPTKFAISQIKFHPLSFNQHNTEFGLIYQQLARQTSGKIDYLFLAPSMSGFGGTEKLMGNYIRAIKDIHPDWHIAILSRIPYNKATLECKFFPKGVDFIDFGRITKGLNSWEVDILWSRLLTQSKVKRLHIVNDEYWYRWLKNHETLIKNNGYIINASLFMREYSKETNNIVSFADPCLMEIWPFVNKVFTDNQNVINESLENNAFDEEKFKVHYQPEDVDNIVKPKLIKKGKQLKILWASRVSFQKRPDILKKIAEKLDPKNFQIDVYGHLQHYKSSFFDGTNINYKGSFSGGVKTLPLEDYDIYLYTSATDGMPNILLEVVASGLPIVASSAGGVGELIKNGETGYLVDIEDIDGYTKALTDIKSNPSLATKYAISAQDLLKKRHSFKAFKDKVSADID